MTDEERRVPETSEGVDASDAKEAAEAAEAAETLKSDERADEQAAHVGEAAEADADGDEKHSKRKEKEKEKDRKKRELEAKLKEAEDKLAESEDKYLRLAAEYDNYRRRSAKEREGIYGDAYADALSKLLPMLDNLDRASQYTDPEKLADGVKLILKGVPDVLTSLGVEMFGEPGDVFDPTMHSAVAMVEDTEREPGQIVAVFQRGYRRGDKILRYAAVTVAGEG